MQFCRLLYFILIAGIKYDERRDSSRMINQPKTIDKTMADG